MTDIDREIFEVSSYLYSLCLQKDDDKLKSLSKYLLDKISLHLLDDIKALAADDRNIFINYKNIEEQISDNSTVRSKPFHSITFENVSHPSIRPPLLRIEISDLIVPEEYKDKKIVYVDNYGVLSKKEYVRKLEEYLKQNATKIIAEDVLSEKKISIIYTPKLSV